MTSLDKPSLLQFALLNIRSLNNKTFILNDLMCSHHLDMFFITEIWLKQGDNSLFSKLLPADYLFFNTPRLAGRGGGLATVFKSTLKCRPFPSRDFSSFELQTLILTLHRPTLCVLIYRPLKAKDFINDFGELLGVLIPQFDSFLICGDFNIHVDCASDQLSEGVQRFA